MKYEYVKISDIQKIYNYLTYDGSHFGIDTHEIAKE